MATKRRYLSNTPGNRSIMSNGRYNSTTQRQIINDYLRYKGREIDAQNSDDLARMNIFGIPSILGRTAHYKYFIDGNNPSYNTVLDYENWLIKNGYYNRPKSNWRGTGGGGTW